MTTILNLFNLTFDNKKTYAFPELSVYCLVFFLVFIVYKGSINPLSCNCAMVACKESLLLWLIAPKTVIPVIYTQNKIHRFRYFDIIISITLTQRWGWVCYWMNNGIQNDGSQSGRFLMKNCCWRYGWKMTCIVDLDIDHLVDFHIDLHIVELQFDQIYNKNINFMALINSFSLFEIECKLWTMIGP